MQNIELFKNNAKQIIKQIFLDIISNNSRNNISSFSLDTDENASSISVSYNTFEYFNEKCIEDPQEDKEYYLWYPPEWQVEGVESIELDNLSRELFDKSNESNEKELLETLFSILVELRKEKLFKDMNDNFVLCFHISDYANLEQEIFWNKCINNENIAKDFETWRRRVEINYQE